MTSGVLFQRLETSTVFVSANLMVLRSKEQIRLQKQFLADEFFTDVEAAMPTLREYVLLTETPNKAGSGGSWNKNPESPDQSSASVDTTGSESLIRYLYDELVEVDTAAPFIRRQADNPDVYEKELNPHPQNVTGIRNMKKIAKRASTITRLEEELYDLYSFLRIIYLRGDPTQVSQREPFPPPELWTRDIPQSLRVGQQLMDVPYRDLFGYIEWGAVLNMCPDLVTDLTTGSLEYASQSPILGNDWRGKWFIEEIEQDLATANMFYDEGGVIGVEAVLLGGEKQDFDANVHTNDVVQVTSPSGEVTVQIRKPSYMETLVGSITQNDLTALVLEPEGQILKDIRRGIKLDKRVVAIYDLLVNGEYYVQGDETDGKDYRFENGEIQWVDRTPNINSTFVAKIEVVADTAIQTFDEVPDTIPASTGYSQQRNTSA